MGVVRGLEGGGLLSPARTRVFSLLCPGDYQVLNRTSPPRLGLSRIKPLPPPSARRDEEEEGRASERVFAGA